MMANALSGLADKFNDIKEANYATHKKEPLGKPMDRGYDWPSHYKSPNHKFGKPTVGLESAKEMLFPHATVDPEADLKVSALYRKSHGAYSPGEQHHRNYNWTIDSADHRFGYTEKKVAGGAAAALNPEKKEEEYPKTVIVKRALETHMQAAADQLGKSKDLR